MSTYIDLDSIWRDRQAYPNPCDYELTPEQVNTWVRGPREVRAIPQNANERPLDFVSSINVLGSTLPYPRIEIYAPKLIEVDSVGVGGIMTTIDPHGLVTGDIVMTSASGYSSKAGIQRNIEYHVLNVTPTTFQVELVPGSGALSLVASTGLGLIMGVINDPTIPNSNYDSIMASLNAATRILDFPRIYLDFHSRRYNDTRFIKTIGGILADAKFVLVLDKIQYDDVGRPIWLHFKSCGEQVMRFKRDDPMIVRFMSRDGTTISFFTESDLSIVTNPDKQTMITINVTPYLRDAVFTNHAVEPIA